MHFPSPPKTIDAHAQALVAALLLALLLVLPILALAADDPDDQPGILTALSWGTAGVALYLRLVMPDVAKSSILLAALSLPEYLSSRFGEKRFGQGRFVSLALF